MLSHYQQSFVSLLLVLVSVNALALSNLNSSSPIVNLPYGSFKGKVVGNLVKHLGIPFAAPPTGERRFGLPEDPLSFDGIRQATAFGAACPQQNITFNSTLDIEFPTLSNVSEDCLFINVVRPNVSIDKLLPVVFYIHGGGFEIGDTSQRIGDDIVKRSVDLDEPVIYVAANYRLNGFGFLGGKEVRDAGIGNAGLLDQRFALLWVQKFISKFGGDPEKVTIWGDSAGGISVGLHLLFNNGDSDGLFTGAIMESGFPMRLPGILDQQKYFDGLVDATDCTESSDRLACLRAVPFAKLMAAINLSPNLFSYQGLDLAWGPMVDGKVFESDPLELLESGKYAKIPFIAGDVEDEGTIFAFSSLNVTTDTDFLKYIKEFYLPDISDADLTAVANAYSDDVTQGSPFNTGTANALTPQFKRLAAFIGDVVFQAHRRLFLAIASKTQAAFSYRYMRGSSTPLLGAAHGTDIPDFFGLGDKTDFTASDAIIYFVRQGNPNAPRDSISLLGSVVWEKWSSNEEKPPLLTFVDADPSITITQDIYRKEAIKLIIEFIKCRKE